MQKGIHSNFNRWAARSVIIDCCEPLSISARRRMCWPNASTTFTIAVERRTVEFVWTKLFATTWGLTVGAWPSFKDVDPMVVLGQKGAADDRADLLKCSKVWCLPPHVKQVCLLEHCIDFEWPRQLKHNFWWVIKSLRSIGDHCKNCWHLRRTYRFQLDKLLIFWWHADFVYPFDLVT